MDTKVILDLKVNIGSIPVKFLELIKMNYTNPTIQEHQETEIDYCHSCGCYTLNLISHNDSGKIVGYNCLKCKGRNHEVV